MARHIAAETGSYAAVYRVRTSAVCGHERCFNLGNFQIECVRHYGTATMNAGARPMDMATIATRDISVSPVSPYIGTRYRCLLSPLVLSILAVGRGETGARLRYEIFHRRREHYHFTSTPLSILFSFPSFLPSSLSLSRRRKGRITQLRIRCWRSRESTTKMDEREGDERAR